jgi:hypothetical protein
MTKKTKELTTEEILSLQMRLIVRLQARVVALEKEVFPPESKSGSSLGCTFWPNCDEHPYGEHHHP